MIHSQVYCIFLEGILSTSTEYLVILNFLERINMGKIFYYISRAFVIFIGFSVFLSIPFLLSADDQQVVVSIENLYTQFLKVVNQFVSFDFTNFISLWMETDIVIHFLYSMRLIGISVVIVFISGCILSYTFYLAPVKIRNGLRSIFNFIEGIPDLLIIFIFIMGIIKLYKSTGIHLLSIYGFNAEPLVIPIVIISFLPTLFFTQLVIKLIDEEREKDHIILIKAKGIPYLHIFFLHLLPNIFPLVLTQLRSVIWVILSNTVIIEQLLELRGYTRYLLNILSMDSITVLLNFVIFALPFIFLDLLSTFIKKKKYEVPL
jgi:peptide/nickel transport system permease protein